MMPATEDRPPRGAKRFVARIREVLREHYERGLGDDGYGHEKAGQLDLLGRPT